MLPGKTFHSKTLFLTILMALIIVTSVLFSGCSKGDNEEPKPEKQSAQGGQQSEKIPDQLKSIEDGIEKIIKTLNGPAVETQGEKDKEQAGQEKSGGQESGDKSQSEDKQKEEGQGGKKEEGQGESSQSGQEGGGTQDNQAQKQPKPTDPWHTITPDINDLHYKWNAYMPMAVKKGADKKLIDNFGTALNSLTNTIITKNKTNTLMAASFLYAYVPDFYSLYKTSTSPEIKRIRHYTRNAMLNAMTANWTQADYDMNSLKSSWALFKNIVGKDQQDASNKLDFSIYELDKVMKERNQPIIDIKGRITIANIQALEKSMEKGAGQGGEGSQEGGGQGGGQGSESGSQSGNE